MVLNRGNLVVHADRAYRAIGEVVVCSQFFEFAFLTCAKLALAQEHVTEFSQISPLSQSKSFKQATSAVLKELRGTITLDPEFEAKLESAVERRHMLIHRWVLESGWPVDTDDPKWVDVAQFAILLSHDLIALAWLLMDAFTEWSSKFPEIPLGPMEAEWRNKLPAAYRSIRLRAK